MSNLLWKRVVIDVIIPYHAQYKAVESLIQSLLRTSGKFTITIVDDASKNVSYGNSLSDRGFNYIRNDEQIGFGASLRRGYIATNNPYVCFMHSDLVLSDQRWLIELLNTYASGGLGTAFAVPKTNNPGSIKQLYGKQKSYTDDMTFNEGTCPLYCFLSSRKMINEIGLPNPYPYAMYEDDEYSYRIKKRGFKIQVSGKSWVHHEGGLTINAIYKDEKIATEMQKNRDRCINDMRSL